MPNIKDEIWVTNDGTPIKVGDMNEHHAKNTLRMLIRQIRKGKLTNLGYHQERLYEAKLLDEIENSWRPTLVKEEIDETRSV